MPPSSSHKRLADRAKTAAVDESHHQSNVSSTAEEGTLNPPGHRGAKQNRPAIHRDCLHGGPPPKSRGTAVRVALFSQCIMDSHSSLNRGLQDAQRSGMAAEFAEQAVASMELNCWESFWSRPEHAKCVDEAMWTLTLSHAADAALDGNYSVSRSFIRLAMYLKAWHKLGRTEFLKALHSQPWGEDAAEVLSEMSDALHRTRTDRGTILFLQKQIGCGCMDALAGEAREEPKTGKCQFCEVQADKKKLYVCARCKKAEYCSKECQAKAWKAGHKLNCIPAGE
uniref:MYND-type domain-containing protein n=1 Tax=Hemiselmis tepida TaxID=464990 RepID=A0A7S0VFI5_9CRYP|mmetsp:Transcript_16304/g.41246  ORF Transcript_16304/g.41246 Transcript_16304/m.41246 type:complete len:282 (+) Transcript_16304:99-944(+)